MSPNSKVLTRRCIILYYASWNIMFIMSIHIVNKKNWDSISSYLCAFYKLHCFHLFASYISTHLIIFMGWSDCSVGTKCCSLSPLLSNKMCSVKRITADEKENDVCACRQVNKASSRRLYSLKLIVYGVIIEVHLLLITHNIVEKTIIILLLWTITLS